MKHRIRKKGNKYTVEKWDGHKWESRTLHPEKLWKLLAVSQNVSKPNEQKDIIHDVFYNQKFLQYLLGELPKHDTISKEPTEEDIKKSLEELK